MSLDNPESMKAEDAGRKYAIVASRYNQDLVDQLIDSVLKTFDAAGVKKDALELIRVPGSHEIPYTLSMLAETRQFNCLIALGVIIAGETDHHEIIAQSTSLAIQQIAMETQTPVINGIITATREQAEARCGGEINRGVEFANGALEMARVGAQLNQLWVEQGLFENNVLLGREEPESWDDFIDEDEAVEEK